MDTIRSPRVTEYTGQEKNQLQLNEMLSLTKTAYRMRMELFRFPGHCLRGRMKLRKSSNTLKTRMTTLKSQMSSTTMLKRTNQMMTNNIKPILYLFCKTQQRMTQRMNHLNHKVDLNALQGTKELPRDDSCCSHLR